MWTVVGKGGDALKALIVDDSAVMRKVLQRALQECGLDIDEVVEATNGQEALQLLRAEPRDVSARVKLILCDINMPVMDGLSFLEQARREQLAEDVPVVIVTTEGSEAQVLRAIAAGARGYICKPFTSEQVRSRVQPLLRAAA
jgi:two-component system chemotaxis response regulator CheY